MASIISVYLKYILILIQFKQSLIVYFHISLFLVFFWLDHFNVDEKTTHTRKYFWTLPEYVEFSLRNYS